MLLLSRWVERIVVGECFALANNREPVRAEVRYCSVGETKPIPHNLTQSRGRKHAALAACPGTRVGATLFE